jgi:hypothetical protein
MFLMEQKSLLFIFSSAAPQSYAYSEVPSQMAAHLRTGSPLQAGEFVGFQTQDCSFTMYELCAETLGCQFHTEIRDLLYCLVRRLTTPIGLLYQLSQVVPATFKPICISSLIIV